MSKEEINDALIAAVYIGNINIVSVMLEKNGIDLEFKNVSKASKEQSAMSLAIELGHYDIVCQLIHHDKQAIFYRTNLSKPIEVAEHAANFFKDRDEEKYNQICKIIDMLQSHEPAIRYDDSSDERDIDFTCSSEDDDSSELE